MITNARQYRITQSALRRLREGLDAAEKSEPNANINPNIHRAMQEGIMMKS